MNQSREKGMIDVILGLGKGFLGEMAELSFGGISQKSTSYWGTIRQKEGSLDL